AETENHIFADYELHQLIYLAIAAALTLLVIIAVLAIIRRQSSLLRMNNRLDAALENIAHGLCMFDEAKRLVICNNRYAQIYHLPPELLKIGTPHQAIISHRVQNGILAGENNAAATDKKLNELGQLSSNKISNRV